MSHLYKLLLASGALALAASGANALTWIDWTSADSTSAAGTMGSVGVTFTGAQNPASQTSGAGLNYWATNSGIYTPTGAENPPPDSDIIRLTGGSTAGTYTLTFDKAVKDPYMAVLSVGQSGFNVTYDFDTPFDILNQGTGHWGGSATAMTELAGDILSANEGHGLLQFSGLVTSISWTVPTAEFWHGFTIAMDDPAAIPVPAALPMMAGGLAMLGFAARRRKSG